MAVKIRLARVGKKSRSAYRVVAIDESKRRNGKEIELLGTFDPHLPSFSGAKLNKKRIEYWLSVGATPTPTVAALLK